MRLNLNKLRLANSDMFFRFIKLITKLQKIYSNSDKGNGKAFTLLMKEFDVVKWVLFNIDDQNFKEQIFYTFYFAYKLDGNRYHSQYELFYNYISKFSFNNSVNDLQILFRVMTHKEFQILKINGNTNPSWSGSINKIHKFASIKLLTRECKKSILVAALYKKSDIIFCDKNDEEKEYVVRANSKPIKLIQLFNFHLPYIKQLFSIDIETPFIFPNDINNGYGWLSALKKKGVDLKSDECLNEQFNDIVQMRLKNNFNLLTA